MEYKAIVLLDERSKIYVQPNAPSPSSTVYLVLPSGLDSELRVRRRRVDHEHEHAHAAAS